MLNIKTQTKRSTKWIPNLVNINVLCDGFEFAIVTSQGWGDFKPREEPKIIFTIEEPGRSQVQHEIPLSEFVLKLKEEVSK